MIKRSSYCVFVLFLAFCCLLVACSRESSSAPSRHDFAASRTFPYQAPSEQIESLRTKGRSIELGFDKKQVADVLGAPDYQKVYFDPGAWLKNYIVKHEFSWTYVYFAEYPFGMGTPDGFIEVGFNQDGFVKQVLEKEPGRKEPSDIK